MSVITNSKIKPPALRNRSSLGSWGSEDSPRKARVRKPTKTEELIATTQAAHLKSFVPLLAQDYTQCTERSKNGTNTYDGVMLLVQICNYDDLVEDTSDISPLTDLLETFLLTSQQYQGDVVDCVGSYISLVWITSGAANGFQLASEKAIISAHHIHMALEELHSKAKIKMGIASGCLVFNVIGGKHEWRYCLSGNCFDEAKDSIDSLPGGKGIAALTVDVVDWVTHDHVDKKSTLNFQVEKIPNTTHRLLTDLVFEQSGIHQLAFVESDLDDPTEPLDPALSARFESYFSESQIATITNSERKVREVAILAISLSRCSDSARENILSCILKEIAHFEGELHTVLPGHNDTQIFISLFGMCDNKAHGGISDEVSRAIQFSKTLFEQIDGVTDLHIGLSKGFVTTAAPSSGNKTKGEGCSSNVRRAIIAGTTLTKAMQLMRHAVAFTHMGSVALTDTPTKSLVEVLPSLNVKFTHCSDNWMLDFQKQETQLRPSIAGPEGFQTTIWGRSSEVLRAANALRSVQKGTRHDVEEIHRSVIVSGEMGVGKSKFLSRVVEIAESRRMSVLTCNSRDLLYVDGARFTILCELFGSTDQIKKDKLPKTSEEMQIVISFLLDGKQKRIGGDIPGNKDEHRGHAHDVELTGELIMSAAVVILDASFPDTSILFVIDDCDLEDESLPILTQLSRLYSRLGIFVSITGEGVRRNDTVHEMSGSFSSSAHSAGARSRSSIRSPTRACLRRSWCANAFSLSSTAVTHIFLSQLDNGSMSSLLSSYSQVHFGKQLSPNVVDLIGGICDGNPSYGEKLLSYLMSEKLFKITDNHIMLPSDYPSNFDRVSIPSNGSELFQKRFDLLSSSLQTIAKCCAFLRPVVTLQDIFILRSTSSISSQDEPTDICDKLVDAKMFKKIEGTGWRFASEQDRLFLIASVTGDNLIEIHIKIADTLLELRSEGVDVCMSDIMMHFRKGGETQRCLAFSTEASEEAFIRGRYAEALLLTETGVSDQQDFMSAEHDNSLQWAGVAASSNWELGKLNASLISCNLISRSFGITPRPTSWLPYWFRPIKATVDQCLPLLRIIKTRCMIEYQRGDQIALTHLSTIAKPLITTLLANPPPSGTSFVDPLIFFESFLSIKPYAAIRDVTELKKRLLKAAKTERSAEIENGMMLCFMMGGLTKSVVSFEYPLSCGNALTKIVFVDLMCLSIVSQQPSVWDRLRRMHGIATAEKDLLMTCYAKSLLQYTQLRSGIKEEEEDGSTSGLDALITESFTDLRESVSPARLLQWISVQRLFSQKVRSASTIRDAMVLADQMPLQTIPGMLPLLTLHCLLIVLSTPPADGPTQELTANVGVKICRLITVLESLQHDFAYARPVYRMWKALYQYRYKKKIKASIADLKTAIAELTYFSLPDFTLYAEELLLEWTGSGSCASKVQAVSDTCILLQSE
eukprot:TRINITY_DN17542_c0_g2_i2.p1 TRINITY_DN17542_c0_g2~~TRINITY_DN17542_c0_g2_i2.p1  ORF type:complete len:1435 (+),score=227.80 TRINITY_DN17542_c0_g2_i2:1170-5474(+)